MYRVQYDVVPVLYPGIYVYTVTLYGYRSTIVYRRDDVVCYSILFIFLIVSYITLCNL